ncbi:hypothetical protein MJO29_004188, partial [Puccinia striiformis f. sp. tritici]
SPHTHSPSAQKRSTASHPHCPASTSQAAMTSIPNHLIFHPIVSSSLKVGNTTVGRDKLYRTIQYFSRFLVWYFEKNGYDKQTIMRFNNLKSALGVSRKLMRLGKPFEHLQAALKGTKEMSDPILGICGVGRQISYAIYLFNDMMIWADKIKFITLDKIDLALINKRAAQFWLTGITLNMIAGIYKHHSIRLKLRKLKRNQNGKTLGGGGEHEKEEKKYQIQSISAQSVAVRLQLLQDFCDFLSPSSTLGYHSLNDGVIGGAGVISSLLGLRSQVNKVLGSG